MYSDKEVVYNEKKRKQKAYILHTHRDFASCLVGILDNFPAYHGARIRQSYTLYPYGACDHHYLLRGVPVIS